LACHYRRKISTHRGSIATSATSSGAGTRFLAGDCIKALDKIAVIFRSSFFGSKGCRFMRWSELALLKGITTFITAIALGFSIGQSRAQPPETIHLKPGFADARKLSRAANTVVVGNPEVADANVAPGNIMLLTGKRAGSTNVIALDESGSEIYRAIVEIGDNLRYRIAIRFPIRAPGGGVIHTYWCEGYCNLRPMRAKALEEPSEVASEQQATSPAGSSPGVQVLSPAGPK
jgi:hypothetical protein